MVRRKSLAVYSARSGSASGSVERNSTSESAISGGKPSRYMKGVSSVTVAPM